MRGDGCSPMMGASRDTRPPSSSTLTASGSGPVEAAIVGQGAVLQHRQVGPAADHDAADVVVGRDGAGVLGAGHADHQELCELVAGGQGVDDGFGLADSGGTGALGAGELGAATEASLDGAVDDPESLGLTTNTTMAPSNATASTVNAIVIHREACHRGWTVFRVDGTSVAVEGSAVLARASAVENWRHDVNRAAGSFVNALAKTGSSGARSG